MNTLVLLILAATAVAVHADCGGYPDGHTMCLPEKPCTASMDSICGGISEADKKLILDKHNEMRNKVASGKETQGKPGPQPAGGDIYEMTWSDELATIAQRWADQFKLALECSDCRKLADGSSVGQNVYFATRSKGIKTPEWERCIDSFSEEVALVDGRDISKKTEDTCRYFKMLRGEYKEIGCGAYSPAHGCGDVIPGWGNIYCTLYVCNYAPKSKGWGKPLYTSAQCLNKSSKYPFLCV